MKTLAMRLAAIGAALLSASAAVAAPPPAQPKLVVAISVDQLSLELYERYRPTFTGGLKRLGEGLAFTGYQSHGATETCPGHSTILTGAHPARTGIVANSWYDRASGKTVYCVSVEGGGEPDARGPGKLRVDALGDWLKQARPGARSVAVSGKDRGAIMMAGQHPDAVYWWADKRGFATSRHAGPTTPQVLAPAEAFNAARSAAWRAAPPRLWPQQISARCAALQKPHRFGALELSGAVPPQTAPGGVLAPDARDFDEELRASPELDRLTLAFADQLVDRFRLGQGPQTDLLAISLSATDAIGHRYGNGGAESCVQLASLDAALGAFLAGLDRRGVPYVVMLTADHGAIDAAERLDPPAIRVDGRAITRGLARHLQATFGLSYEPVAGNSRQIVLTLAAADAPRRGEILAVATAWLKARPEVAAAYTAAEIAAVRIAPGTPVTALTVPERFAESFDAERSGDILVAYVERATVGMPRELGDSVAGHGSPWDYDRRVPILFWWRGVTPAREAAPMETVDIAPTLAPLMAVAAPQVDGRCVEIGQGCAVGAR
ncbi:alkaline phosphatase family protein [Phenylobacterium sp. LjRoot219]|uniref:alkaline phosphatase family protein n=1 Tax=Phenylobacterium sp. LjRoot219 TaxID=3342283 RepID=UPI003ECC6A20